MSKRVANSRLNQHNGLYARQCKDMGAAHRLARNKASHDALAHNVGTSSEFMAAAISAVMGASGKEVRQKRGRTRQSKRGR